MSVEENKALYQRVFEAINRGDLAVFDEVLTNDWVNHDPFASGLPRGPEGAKQFIGMLLAAFPDHHYTIEDLIGEGDKVVLRFTARGTHKGEFVGIAPTGKQVTYTGIVIGRVAGGKGAEMWVNVDHLGMMQQLGVVPPPGQPSK